MAALGSAGLLTSTAEQRLIPARDLRGIKLVDILDSVRDSRHDVVGAEHNAWNSTVQALAKRVDQAIDDAMSNATLADLVAEDRASAEIASNAPSA
jgi:DNA-binding IscR family transcriptional regulator